MIRICSLNILNMPLLLLLGALLHFFTACLRHGYRLSQIHDCVLIPIPKSGKDSSSSQNYRPIALASTMSKVIELVILRNYDDLLYTSPLQFGFKPGLSTSQQAELTARRVYRKPC